ncbi:malto-oligosyltrehalose synthase [Altericista sp. CCNU0014]|uniref:malto-oligosyltrehalose synthase n=1 Tax=Altericista sp. CCNU0014 TaxID=3082949 RepID=UPI00384F8363
MRIPIATYRLQFHRGFPFEAAQNIAGYLADLGISDIYASPIFKARAKSSHGYDVVDPNQLNPELGTPEQFAALARTVRHYDMGWLQDIVPNHMAYDSQNPYLMDILENGPDAEDFDFFDIEWDRASESLKGRVLAPLLGNFYGECLENGELQLAYEETGLSLYYHALKLPIRLDSYARFITQKLGQLAKALGRNHPGFIKLLGVLYLVKSIPAEAKGRERYDGVKFVKSLLWELYTQNKDVKAVFEATIEFFNGEQGKPESFNALDALLSEQFYRLSFWKVGAEEINYRRFFTVNELISVKVEELRVFNKTHALIEELVAQGTFTGLRVDHIDGLYDPAQYLKRLKQKIPDTYVTVEKILELQEDLPSEWEIEGTSGYDFLNYANGIFCLSARESSLQESYLDFTQMDVSYEELIAQKKRLILEKNLAGDVDNLAQKLKSISAQTRAGTDFTRHGLTRALSEVLALFPVYRTYITSDRASDTDRTYIKTAIAKAVADAPLLHRELTYIQTLLLGQDESSLAPEQQTERLNFVMKFQQLTGPLMAKGVEDTALYIYNRLLSLNEVGGNPSQFGISLEAFHCFNQRRGARWPYTQNASATHDTKRGEDVRARLNILSEVPHEWNDRVGAWQKINDAKKLQVNGKAVPSRNDEYFLYHTLVGAFPFEEAERPEFIERVKQYAIKAVREAKVYTAWLRPNVEYEDGYALFVETILRDAEFLQAFCPFQQRIATYGIFNSLSQLLLKVAAPGIPDFYQGNELWDLSLVDPDNRRPVDYARRISLLGEIQRRTLADPLALIAELLASPEDGRVKLFLTTQLLQARKSYRDVFEKGSYQPLNVIGKFAEHVVAFARWYQGTVAIAIAPRFLTGLVEPPQLPLTEAVWQDTQVELPEGVGSIWTNAVTAESGKFNARFLVGQAFQHFPAALLIAQT